LYVALRGTLSIRREKLRPKFQLVSKSFAAFVAAICKIAAVQRRWRDFRIAPLSCERGNFGCQNIGRCVVAAERRDWRVS